MGAASIFELASAFVAVAAVIFSAGRFAENVKANTHATEKLSEVIDSHLTWSAAMAREVADRFHNHETRLVVLEKAGK